MGVVGFLYTANQRWAILNTEYSLLSDHKTGLQKEFDSLQEKYTQLKSLHEVTTLKNQLKITQLQKQLDREKERECPECEECPRCPVCPRLPVEKTSADKTLELIKKPCWGNSPLYQQGFDCDSCQGSAIDWPWEKPLDVCSYLSLGGCCRFRHLLGFSYEKSPQLGWGDLMMLDFAFTGHQYLKNIVEFGSFTGITSTYLGMLAHLRQGSLTTFDIEDKRHSEVIKAWNSKYMKYILADLLKETPDPKVVKAVAQNDTLYFFDNGDKTGECNNFLKYFAKTDNIMCTHDWDIEVTLESLQDKLDQYGWIPWAFKHAEMLGSHVRCFKRGANRRK